MTKDFIELMKDIKENKIKEGTRIKNIDGYRFTDRVFS